MEFVFVDNAPCYKEALVTSLKKMIRDKNIVGKIDY